MKSDIITQLHKNFENFAHQLDGEEFWLARELQSLLGYSQWRNFELVIDKAKTACVTAGHSVADHFADVSKTIPMPKGSGKEIDDLMLTRYACYLKRDDLRHEGTITYEHIKNNLDVRKVLTDRGIVPEALPPAEDIKKLERRMKSEEKLIAKKAGRCRKGSTGGEE